MRGSPSMLPTKRPLSLSVSGRVLLFTLVVWVGLLAGLHGVLDKVFRPTFARIESNLIIKDLERVEAAVSREAQQLGITASDYASWAEMRDYLGNGGPTPRVLEEGILKTLGLDAAFVFDAFGRPKHALTRQAKVGPEGHEFSPTGFAAEFPVLANAKTQGAGSGAAREGLVRFRSGKLVFAAAAPVVSEGAKEALGTVVMLRELDGAGLRRLSEQVRLTVTLLSGTPAGPAVRAHEAEAVIENGRAEATAWIRDPFGKPIASFSVNREASILGQGEHTLNLAGIGSLFMLSLVLSMLLLLIQLSVVRPLAHLTRAIENVRRTGDLDLRIGINRNDEIGLVAYNFDRLLALLSERTQVLEELATTDGLTKLLNRRTIMDRLGEQMDLSSENGESLSILLLDVDHFKRINDTAGHAVGDRVLRQVAGTLRDSLRKNQSAGRYGGEEFLLVLPGHGKDRALQAAERLREAIADTNIQGLSWKVTVSIGIATFDGQTTHGLLATADANLYRAKESGRNRVVADDIAPSLLPAASIPPPSAHAGRRR